MALVDALGLAKAQRTQTVTEAMAVAAAVWGDNDTLMALAGETPRAELSLEERVGEEMAADIRAMREKAWRQINRWRVNKGLKPYEHPCTPNDGQGGGDAPAPVP